LGKREGEGVRTKREREKSGNGGTGKRRALDFVVRIRKSTR